MNILVTGGAGDIGAYVIKDLLAQGLEPTILDVRPPRKPDPRVPYVSCDLMSLKAAVETIRGYDAVLHLAAIPHPFNDPAERVMSVNMVTTYNVLEAVRLNKIPRIVYGCSESSTGFGIHNAELKPLYLPIDEPHPLWPHEVYSLTKRFGEEMVEQYSNAYGIEGISLRYCWVWLQRDAASIRSVIEDQLAGKRDEKNWFGCYIAPHDVAQGCRRALQYRFPAAQAKPFEAFYLTAQTTFLNEPTLQALAHHFDPLPAIRDDAYFRADPFAPPFDTRKAQRLLGFKAEQSWREFERWEPA